MEIIAFLKHAIGVVLVFSHAKHQLGKHFLQGFLGKVEVKHFSQLDVLDA